MSVTYTLGVLVIILIGGLKRHPRPKMPEMQKNHAGQWVPWSPWQDKEFGIPKYPEFHDGKHMSGNFEPPTPDFLQQTPTADAFRKTKDEFLDRWKNGQHHLSVWEAREEAKEIAFYASVLQQTRTNRFLDIMNALFGKVAELAEARQRLEIASKQWKDGASSDKRMNVPKVAPSESSSTAAPPESSS